MKGNWGAGFCGLVSLRRQWRDLDELWGSGQRHALTPAYLLLLPAAAQAPLSWLLQPCNSSALKAKINHRQQLAFWVAAAAPPPCPDLCLWASGSRPRPAFLSGLGEDVEACGGLAWSGEVTWKAEALLAPEALESPAGGGGSISTW